MDESAEQISHQTALQRLQRISSRSDQAFDEKISDLLELGCTYLGLEIGFLSYIDADDDRFEIQHARGSHDLITSGARDSLSRTYCRKAITSDSLLGVQNAPDEGWTGDPAYERYNLGCYLGGKLLVDGALYGTLCFADEQARDVQFSETERTFVELLVEWASYELQRREYQHEITATRERLETTLERIDDVVVSIDDDWMVTYFNRRAEEVFGVDAATARGSDFRSVTSVGAGDALYERLERAMETQSVVTVEEYDETLDVWLEVQAYPSDDGLSIYATDVTERKRREQALREERQFVDEILDALDDILFVLDTDGQLIRWNERVTEMSDLDEETLETMQATELLPSADRSTIQGTIQRVLETGQATLEADLVAEMETREYEFRASRLTGPEGDPIGICGIGRDVTDRNERERQLRQYEAALENLRGMVYVADGDGRFSLLTPELADRLGYERDRLRGASASDVFADPAAATGETLTGPDDVASVDTEAITADGDRVPVHVETTPIGGGAGETVGAVRDVTELRSTRRALRDERDRFRYLFDTIPDPVVEARLSEDRSVIESVNTAFETVFGQDEADVVGRSPDASITGEDDASLLPDRLERGTVTTTELRRETADGHRDFLFRAIPYTRSDDAVYAFGLYTDITEQKRRERHLNVLSRLFRHNLRNKLSVIVGNADILREAVGPEYAPRVDQIDAAATDLTTMSRKASQIDSLLNAEEQPVVTVDVAEVLADTIADVQDDHPEVDLTLTAPSGLTALAHPRVRTVFEELLENAIEHNDAAEKRVRVDATVADRHVEIEIADNGPGIPRLEREILTGEREITQLHHGQGLGLWLVQWLLHASDGDLAFDVDDGTTVRITLERT